MTDITPMTDTRDNGTDIVERLKAVSPEKNPFETISLLSRAASEIVSLRKELEEARGALERLASPLAFISSRSTNEEERARMFYAEGFLKGVEDLDAYAVHRALKDKQP